MKNQGVYNEANLLFLLKDGNSNALQQVYNIYGHRLYINILKLVKDETTARELLQDVFIKLWRNRETANINDLSAYLFTISTNCIYDFFRKERTKQRHIALILPIATQHYNNIEEAINNKETTLLLHKALNALPVKRRQVFELCKLEGKSYAEVSTLLGISVSTINDHIVKATKVLQQHLKLR